ncbi:MAG: DUF5009 domain-containing protein [Candidatus Sumerlaeia bacterium]|nr:DUF5009 domain-containing protein [Candidatus Sumerlaeia bacterium]
MAEPLLAGQSERLESLDVFRGITIAAMVLVNNPGSWAHIYPPLAHAQWDGWTPTDFIFPFFLFIVGVAMTFSFDKRLARGDTKLQLFGQVVRRSIILFLLGMILTGFPNFRLITPYILIIVGLPFIYTGNRVFSRGADPAEFRRKIIGWCIAGAGVLWFLLDLGHFNAPTRVSSFAYMFPLTNDLNGSIIRIPGVLQRIALCYLVASIIVLNCGLFGRIAWTLVLINIYWLILRYIPVPGGYVLGDGGGRPDPPADAPFPGTLIDWLDVKLLGQHLYSFRPDPEGILSTIPAIATTVSGVLTGHILRIKQDKRIIAALLLILGNALIIIGACMDLYFPINKKNWSSSYVVFTTGWGMAIFAVCYYLNDIKGWRKWSYPFLVFGTNAILVFFASGIMARVLSMIRFEVDGSMTTLRSWIYGFFIRSFGTERPDGTMVSDVNSSLAFALVYIALWFFITWPLFLKRIFLKV